MNKKLALVSGPHFTSVQYIYQIIHRNKESKNNNIAYLARARAR